MWGASASASIITRRVNPSSSVYVRTAPGAFTLGTLFANESFTYDTAISPLSAYRYGHGRGTINKCGWVNLDYLTVSSTLDYGCIRPDISTAAGVDARIYLRKYWAKLVNDFIPDVPGAYNHFFLDTGDGTTTDVVTTTNVWANFDFAGTYSGPSVDFLYASSSRFKWRYVSQNGVAVLGRRLGSYSGESTPWGFIPRSYLLPALPYADGITRNDIEGGGGSL